MYVLFEKTMLLLDTWLSVNGFQIQNSRCLPLFCFFGCHRCDPRHHL